MSNSALGSQSIALLTLPAGSLIDYAGTVEPSGWLLCDGRAVSRTAYASLFSALGTSYGVGDGSTTFNIPDFRGRFARYMDNMGTAQGAASRDIGRVRGAAQTDAMQGHHHAQTNADLVMRGTLSGGANVQLFSTSTLPVSLTVGYTQQVQSPSNDGTNGTPRTAAETRPINLSCNKLIKI